MINFITVHPQQPTVKSQPYDKLTLTVTLNTLINTQALSVTLWTQYWIWCLFHRHRSLICSFPFSTLTLFTCLLYLPGCKYAAKYNFFSYRVVSAWNTLPAGKINFQSINGFRASLTNSPLIYQCRLNFACFNLCICMRSVLFCIWCIAVFAVLSHYLLST